MGVLRVLVVAGLAALARAGRLSRAEQDRAAEEAYWGLPPQLELDQGDSDHFTGSNDDCQFTDSKTSAKFDLRPLVARRAHIIRGVTPSDHDSAHLQKFHEEGHDYEEYKTKNFRSTGYDYVVNVCQNVHKRPAECKDKPFAPAYQVAASDVYGTQHPPGCYQLGSLAGWKFSLIDPQFPATGVDLTYSAGESCMRSKEVVNATGHTEVEWEETTRQMTLRFLCDENEASDIESILRMGRRLTTTEPEMCQYRVDWPSIFGCPLNPQSAWKRAEAAPREAAPAPAAGGRGLVGGLYALLFWVLKMALYAALFVFVLHGAVQLGANRDAIYGIRQQLLAGSATEWRMVLRLLVPANLGSFVNSVHTATSGKKEGFTV